MYILHEESPCAIIADQVQPALAGLDGKTRIVYH